ncbi:VG15 protein [Nocardiopsis salina]|uniref:VG15 protein n=1 Tax=Nocardiopsis salina TaxID=245836 RepID=UPI000348098E|nr:hypothetical protein [Nocardiopsis salina]
MSTRAALAHQRGQDRIARGAADEVGQVWAQIDERDIRSSWLELVPRAATILAAAQLASALGAEEYLDELLGVAAPVVAAPAWEEITGTASDGRSLDTLLLQPGIRTLTAVQRGATPRRALMAGRIQLDTIARTQVTDAGRAAEQLGVAVRPRVVAYTRVVAPSACSRCMILAGREYSWSQGFQRHPRCKCTMRPLRPGERVDGDSPRALFDGLTREQQDKQFGRHAAEAIREGADMSQVVNARRGMQPATDRSRGRYTTEGTTRRGYAGRRLGELTDTSGRYARSRRPRLMPEAIMRDAADRQRALELLHEHGYLTDPPPPATSGGS